MYSGKFRKQNKLFVYRLFYVTERVSTVVRTPSFRIHGLPDNVMLGLEITYAVHVVAPVEIVPVTDTLGSRFHIRTYL